jgi:hypothetical protein
VSEQTHLLWRFRVKVGRHTQIANLYYHAGNFFYPLFLPIDLEARAKHHILKFVKANRELVRTDRAHPEYQTKLQLAGIED